MNDEPNLYQDFEELLKVLSDMMEDDDFAVSPAGRAIKNLTKCWKEGTVSIGRTYPAD